MVKRGQRGARRTREEIMKARKKTEGGKRGEDCTVGDE